MTRVRSNFVVKGSNFLFQLGFGGLVIIVFIIFLQIIVNDEKSNIIMYFCFAPFLLLGIYLILMAKVFRVTVKGCEIFVRTYIGRRYQFNVSEVEYIEWKKTINGNFYTEQIKIRTKSGKKVTIDKLMDGFKYMVPFVSVNVDAAKIKNKFTVLKSPPCGSPAEKFLLSALGETRNKEDS